ncbi:hypothetical protein PISMIDRAFT_35576, partial [Pisolithus microcarpus 441]
MSEPELAYMTNSNDDFDLPRWQTQAHIEPLSSSAQAAQAAARASYLYPGAPPPPPPPPQSLATAGHSQRLHALHHSPSSSRQPRVTHALDQDQQQSVSTTSYISGALNQLSRSASLGASASIGGTARSRRHHQPADDLEGAFNVDAQSSNSNPRPMGAPQPPSAYSLYPPSTSVHQPLSLQTSSTSSSNPSPATASEPFSEMYYSGSGGNVPKRTHTQLDPASHSGRSPMRVANALLDPYQQHAQYSPTTTPTYLYGPSSSDTQRSNSSATYQSHSR